VAIYKLVLYHLLVKSIVIDDIKYKKPPKGRISLYAAILGFVGSLIFLYIQNFNTVNTLITFHNPKIRYDTYTVTFEGNVPEEYKALAKENVKDMVFNKKERFKFVDGMADITIQSDKSEGNVEVLSETLIPVGHLYSLKTATDEEDITNMNVYVLSDTYINFLKDQYDINAQKVDNVDSLVAKMKESDDNVGLVTYADLNFSMKILKVGNQYYLDNHEAGIHIRFYASLAEGIDSFILDILKKNISTDSSVPDTASLLKLNMSGVVAISRDLGAKMDSLQNYDYPAEKLGSFLADADLTHISNEVSFVDGCVVAAGMRFCAKDKYMESITASGVDIVELTGNHNNDYGSANNGRTIEMYKALGMDYFGGGLNNEDASKILYKEVDGTKLAFIGYNWYDTTYKTGAIAWDDTPGANEYSEEKMKANIAEAKANADIVIVDFQFQECYCYPDGDVVYPICYKPLSNPDQKGVFRKAVDLGATIVIGTQAHQPQTYELYGNGVIYYGLGNLYFDQWNWIGTRQAMILTHYFDSGKYINTKLTPIYMDRSMQPNFATDAQASQLLKSLKTARD
jgi:poly-gamma-glutamate capsule biosynthesis protein CapA/YwtB (metallophosphatase superfamily)